MPLKKNLLLLTGLSLVLAACGSDGLDDLRDFTKNAHANKTPRVQELPIMKRFDTFAYSAGNLMDPFSVINLRPQPKACPGCKIAGLKARRREALEQYPLDSLKMVGTLRKKKKFWVVIQAPDGSVYRAAIGNYMGRNNGMIVKISENKVSLVEKIRTELGGTIDRDASISIE